MIIKRNIFYVILLIFCTIEKSQHFKFNMTDYFSMPDLYDFDDYDRCLLEFHNKSTYCFVRVEIIPQKESRVWQTIENITKYDRHHFDHKHLYFGLCVDWCIDALKPLDNNQTNQLYSGILTNNSKVNTYVNLFSTENGNRRQYNRLLNQCINLRLQQQPQQTKLRALSMIEYCDYKYNYPIGEDMWNNVFYCILCAIILAITLSSCYDLFLAEKCNKMLTFSDHYKTAPAEIYNKVLVAFSLPRNWYRLNQPPSDKTGNELRFLDCFKFFAMFLVIFAHTVWVLYEGAINNPQDPEQMLHSVAGTYLMSGGLIVITFFVISGFLLTLNWLAATKNRDNLSALNYAWLFLQFNVFRYIRLTLPYACILLLSGVYFENAGGPLWRHIMEREQLSCRKNWWTNLLYINNYVNTNERCMLQTWYLAADTHCFIISLLLLILVHKWRNISIFLYSFVAIVAFLVPGLITYIQEYLPLFIPTPQTQKDSFIGNDQFTYFYTSFHMNFGAYFAGILAALTYDHHNKQQLQPNKYLWCQCIWYALIPAGILWMLLPHYFFQVYTEDPWRILGAIFAALQRNIWGMGFSLLIVGMAFGIGSIFRRFACLPMFRILGRLTYGAFILHLFMVRLVVGTIRQPIYFGTGTMFTFVFYNVVSSYLSSFVLAMLVELPVSSLMKLLR